MSARSHLEARETESTEKRMDEERKRHLIISHDPLAGSQQVYESVQYSAQLSSLHPRSAFTKSNECTLTGKQHYANRVSVSSVFWVCAQARLQDIRRDEQICQKQIH